MVDHLHRTHLLIGGFWAKAYDCFRSASQREEGEVHRPSLHVLPELIPVPLFGLRIAGTRYTVRETHRDSSS